jgi:hypothetical protein
VKRREGGESEEGRVKRRERVGRVKRRDGGESEEERGW